MITRRSRVRPTRSPACHRLDTPHPATLPTPWLHHQCELIADWIDDELTRTAIALLPDWVNWLAERADYDEPWRTQLADALTTEGDK